MQRYRTDKERAMRVALTLDGWTVSERADGRFDHYCAIERGPVSFSAMRISRFRAFWAAVALWETG